MLSLETSRMMTAEYLVCLATFGAILAYGVEKGMVMGLVLSALSFTIAYAQASKAVFMMCFGRLCCCACSISFGVFCGLSHFLPTFPFEWSPNATRCSFGVTPDVCHSPCRSKQQSSLVRVSRNGLFCARPQQSFPFLFYRPPLRRWHVSSCESLVSPFPAFPRMRYAFHFVFSFLSRPCLTLSRPLYPHFNMLPSRGTSLSYNLYTIGT